MPHCTRASRTSRRTSADDVSVTSVRVPVLGCLACSTRSVAAFAGAQASRASRRLAAKLMPRRWPARAAHMSCCLASAKVQLASKSIWAAASASPAAWARRGSRAAWTVMFSRCANPPDSRASRRSRGAIPTPSGCLPNTMGARRWMSLKARRRAMTAAVSAKAPAPCSLRTRFASRMASTPSASMCVAWSRSLAQSAR